MYQHVEVNKSNVGLHDCRIKRMSYENQILSLEFPDGFYIFNQNESTCSKNGKMECHIIDEDIDGISIYVYRELENGMIIRENHKDSFMEEVNQNKFEFEVVITFHSYQRILLKGYVWFDEEPYNMECDIELHADTITYLWNDEEIEEQ